VGLKYHYNDEMSNPETHARVNWYGVTAYPTMFVDGIDADWPYDPNWLDSLLFHLTISSPVEITIYGEYDEVTRDGSVSVEVYAESELPTIPVPNYRIFYVLAENDVLGEHQSVVRDMIPDDQGTPVTIEQGGTYTFTADFHVDQAWVPDNCYLAVFIQNRDFSRRVVLQANKEYITEFEPPEAPAVSVSPMSLEFGTVEIGEQVGLPVTVHSIGELPLEIYDVSCNNLSFTTNWDPEDTLLVPGDSLEIMVYFSPVAAIEFNRTMCIETNVELVAVALHGIGQPATAINPGVVRVVPDRYDLHPAYPNPFNPSTNIRFDLPASGEVSLVVFDRLGREVSRLVDGWYDAGTYSSTFDADGLASGVYFVRFAAGDFQQVQKLLLIK